MYNPRPLYLMPPPYIYPWMASYPTVPTPTQNENPSPPRDRESLQPVPIGGHELPRLAYRYDALEPYIVERIMIIHHRVLHCGYVKTLNKTELALKKARESNNYESIRCLERDAAYYGAAHYLHTLFWETMRPFAVSIPPARLRKQLEDDYGSLAAFKKQFEEAALAVEMSGWAILTWCPRSQRTAILMTDKHPNLTQWESIPLLPLDMAEHAYFLQYTYRKQNYIRNWWAVVNWTEVERRWLIARQVRWEPC